MRTRLTNTHTATRQRGYTLIELSIAVLIGLFLLAGLLTIVQQNRRVFGNQNQLSQLQDTERLAMNIITDVVQRAGYFPNPTINTAAGTLPASAPFAVSQSISGIHAVAAPGDSITVRYSADDTQDSVPVLNCSGQPNAAGTNSYVNAFQVVVGAGVSQLVCTMNGTQYPLISGVTNLQVLYGVKTDFTADNYNVDTYLDASQMLAANWNNIISVEVALTFSNPLYVAGQTDQPPQFVFRRVVGVMNRTGVKL